MYSFTAYLDRLPDGLKHHVVVVPEHVAAELRMKGARRVIATLNGVEFRRALNTRKGKGALLIIGKPYLKQIGAEIGDAITVTLVQDEDPDRVDITEEFQAVLDTDQEAAEIFYAFTPGKQRSLDIYVSSAKQTDTRIKRALELAEKIRTRTLHSDRPTVDD